MGKVIIGSARIDERGKLSGGSAGDQKQTAASDYKGEVTLQNFYIHKKGWYVLRLKDPAQAEACAIAMCNACNNSNIGYDQNQRTNVLKYGTRSTTKTECDCSSLVRLCVKEATGKDPGNFTTSTEAAVLDGSGLFEKRKVYKNGVELFNGDILVTKTKGHTVIVVQGKSRIQKNNDCFPIYTGKSDSIVDALISIRVDASLANRKKIAAVNGMPDYSGKAKENLFLLALLKNGYLKKP